MQRKSYIASRGCQLSSFFCGITLELERILFGVDHTDANIIKEQCYYNLLVILISYVLGKCAVWNGIWIAFAVLHVVLMNGF
jgi:hypothetical protein